VKKLTFFLITALFAALPAAYAQSQTEKPKAAVYIMGNPEGRDALRMAVNNYLIKSGQYQMIAVDAIDVVAKEHTRQMSGSVSDAQIAKLGQDAGAKYVCVVERTELEGVSYVATRMVSVESKVAELSEMAVLPKGGIIIDFVKKQVGAMLGMEAGAQPAVAAPTPPPPPPQPTVYTAPAAPSPPPQPAVYTAPAAPPPKAEQIAFTSNPSGAAVNVNGKNIGVTPCSFKPGARGKYTVVVSMSGYEKATKIVEFEGGTLNVPFNLSLSKTTVAPSKTTAAPSPTDQELATQELAALMNALPVPSTQISTSGEFKSHVYLNVVRTKIERNWNPNILNDKIAVMISFEIHSDGSVHAIRVARSSGEDAIDRLGVWAIERSSPFPKLPPNFEGDKVEITITLRPTKYR
jgi:TonB family protein